MENVEELWQTGRCSKKEAARQRRGEGGKEMKEKEMKKRLERKTFCGTSQEENRSSGRGDRPPKKAEARLNSIGKMRKNE